MLQIVEVSDGSHHGERIGCLDFLVCCRAIVRSGAIRMYRHFLWPGFIELESPEHAIDLGFQINVPITVIAPIETKSQEMVKLTNTITVFNLELVKIPGPEGQSLLSIRAVVHVKAYNDERTVFAHVLQVAGFMGDLPEPDIEVPLEIIIVEAPSGVGTTIQCLD